jgi:hypothetical protein
MLYHTAVVSVVPEQPQVLAQVGDLSLELLLGEPVLSH